MLRLLAALVPALRSAFRSRREFLLENIALCQQLATMVQRGQAPHPARRSCLLGCLSAPLVALGRHPRHREARYRRCLAPGRFQAVLAVARKGKRSDRPPVAREVRDLIRKMATENLWGAPRIHEARDGVATRPVSLRVAVLRAPLWRGTYPVGVTRALVFTMAIGLFTMPISLFTLAIRVFTIDRYAHQVTASTCE